MTYSSNIPMDNTRTVQVGETASNTMDLHRDRVTKRVQNRGKLTHPSINCIHEVSAR